MNSLLSSLPGLALSASPAPSQSGGLAAVWDAVSYGLSWFFGNLAPAAVWVLVALAVCLAFFLYYWHCLKPRPHSLEWIAMAETRARPLQMTLTLKRHPFRRGDVLPMLVITLVYAATAFFRLGDFDVPQTYTVFQDDTAFTFSFSQPVTVDKISYYTTLGSGNYRLEYSTDNGESWERITLDQAYNTLLKWEVVDLTQPGEDEEEAHGTITASLWRISAGSVQRYEGLWLAELALWHEGQPLVPQYVSSGGEALFDESDVWADKATYMNSSYFDEIYHPRTALEHLNNIYPYEVSHPPLGKLIIAAGVWLFGMTPFGWRFMGTLCGVLMLPVLYVFL